MILIGDHYQVSSARVATRARAVNSVGPKRRACHLVVLQEVEVEEEDLRKIDCDRGFGEEDREQRVLRLEVKDLSTLPVEIMEEEVEEGVVVAVAVMKIDLRQAECMIKQVVAVTLG